MPYGGVNCISSVRLIAMIVTGVEVGEGFLDRALLHCTLGRRTPSYNGSVVHAKCYH